MNHQTRSATLAAVGVLAALACGCHPSTTTPAEPATALSPAEVQAVVAKALPTWDSAILGTHDGPAWSSELDYAHVLEAMGDTPAGALPDAPRVQDKDRVMRLEPANGRVRYIHRGRAWTPSDAGEPLGDEQAAAKLVGTAVATLGLPAGELGAWRIDTQVAEGAAAGETATTIHELYRVVSAPRLINGLPVAGSRVRAAVTHGGAIQRLAIQWPTFAMPRALKLRSRDEVAAQIVEAVVRHGAVPTTTALPFVTAHLAYAPRSYTQVSQPATVAEDDAPKTSDDDRDETAGNDHDAKDAHYPGRKRHAGETVRYVPVVIVSVRAGETPYQLTVPVAQL